MECLDIESAWEEFLQDGTIDTNCNIKNSELVSSVPKASDIYISTKTKILYLNHSIDLYNLFWKLNIIPYDNNEEGIIKKQIKIISLNNSELEEVQNKLKNYNYYQQQIITHLYQQQSDTTIYKDVRKISIGVSQKDLLSYRCKEKSAFYNCFVLIIRLMYNKKYKEIHVKVFNTGKIEIPGVQNDEIFKITCNYIINTINNLTDKKYIMLEDKTETILINSNFNSGFCINRQELFTILRRKYNLNVSYDPCSYPGIQCKYKVDEYNISFMIFRTGSILIVGKCEEHIIYKVYNFLKTILHDEYNNINEMYNIPIKNKDKTSKSRKKVIYINSSQLL